MLQHRAGAFLCESVRRKHACAGQGLGAILPAVIERVPPPPGDPGKPLRALLFDAYHDEYRGVICLLEIVDGALQKGDRVTAASTEESYDILEVGCMRPYLRWMKGGVISLQEKGPHAKMRAA
jgi:translation elongation factor EF-4